MRRTAEFKWGFVRLQGWVGRLDIDRGLGFRDNAFDL